MKNKYILVLLCFLCFGFILFNSSQVSSVSNTRSKEVVNEVINIASRTKIGQEVLSKITPTELNLIIRKIAHGFEFFLLGSVIAFTLRYFKVGYGNIIIYTLFLVLFIAVIDEFFQIFIQDRNSSVVDVLIDFCGGIVSVILFFTFTQPKGKHNKKIKFYFKLLGPIGKHDKSILNRKKFLWGNGNGICGTKKNK